jgi:serine/threonine protein phosphatase PrpC
MPLRGGSLKAISPSPLQQFSNGRIRFEVTGATDVGLHRDHNEDALGLLPEVYQPAAAQRGHLFAVADGMGGGAKGEVASRLAIEALFAAYYGSAPELPPQAALQAAFAAANEAVHREGQHLQFGMMGTTLVACLLVEDAVLVTNVGDSRAYLLRDRAIYQLSEDHSLVAEQVRAGVLTPDQARRSAQRNIITRAIGHQPTVQGDQYQVAPLRAGDVLLLCSDGLHSLVDDEELLRIGLQADLTRAAAEYIAAANARGGYDNITCLLVRILAVEPRAAAEAPTLRSSASLRPSGEPPTQRLWAVSRPLGLVLLVAGLVLALGLGGAVGAERAAALVARLQAGAPAAAAPARPAFAGMRVSGQVVLPPGVARVPPGVFVAAERAGGPPLTVPVEEGGRYVLTLPEGAPAGLYTLAVRPEQWALTGERDGPRRFAVYPPQPVMLAPGSDVVITLPFQIKEEAPLSVAARGVELPARGEGDSEGAAVPRDPGMQLPGGAMSQSPSAVPSDGAASREGR